MNNASTESAYRVAVRTMTIAAAFSAVVAALLLLDYSRRNMKDPMEATAFKALKLAVAQQPNNAELNESLRKLDLQSRGEFFRQRTFAAVGAGLLVGGLAVCLLAARSAATLRRKLPEPPAQSTPQDVETQWTGVARWAVAALVLLLAGIAVGLSFALQPELPRGQEELAALLGSANGGSPESGTMQGTVAPRSGQSTAAPGPEPAPTDGMEKPVSDEELAKAWPRFRGPGGLGISAYTNVPTTWNAHTGEGIAWKTTVPLPGNNSPVVLGDRVFLSGADEKRRAVFCFDAKKGGLLWQKEVPGTPESTAKPPKINEETGYAASTTATDGRRVYAIFANGDLASFTLDGKLAWVKSLGMPANSYGHASSLAMFKNLLLVQFDQGTQREPKSKLLAFDGATGTPAWETKRDVANSWTSPIVVRAADRDQLVTMSTPWAIAYNPADGKELWRANCLRQDVGPSPSFADGIVYTANEYPCLSAIKADGQGDVTKTHIIWKGEDGLPDTCSPLATKDYVFVLASAGTLTCYEAKKGEKLWEQDFDGTFSSSPSLAGNRLYLIANEGKSWVVEPGQEDCKTVAQGDLGEGCVTSPAFQEARIYLRGKENLFCLEKK